MNYTKIITEYIEANHKNLNQFCKEYEINYGMMHSIVNGKKSFEIAAAKNIEDKIYAKTGVRIFSTQETEDSDMIKIPFYSVKLSAGFGNNIFNEERVGWRYLNRGYIEMKHWNSSHLCVVTVDGESMEKTLLSGEEILIDTSRKEAIDNRIFAIARNGKVWIKRLLINPVDMSIMVTSDNKAHQRYDFPKDEDTLIIGMAVHTLGREL